MSSKHERVARELSDRLYEFIYAVHGTDSEGCPCYSPPKQRNFEQLLGQVLKRVPLGHIVLPRDTPTWEYGYRSHGYWLDGQRVGWVSRPPGRKSKSYGWEYQSPWTHERQEGQVTTLKAGKRKVEKLFVEELKGHRDE